MCGRFTLKSGLTDLLEIFPFLVLPPGAALEPRYNVAPTQAVAAVRGGSRGDSGQGDSGQDDSGSGHAAAVGARRPIEFLRWGLIPFFAKDAAIGNRMINARAETVAEKPAFREPFRRRRCLVLADGFFEWRKEADGKTKTPIYMRKKGGVPFAFAGLWDAWRASDGTDEVVRSCTVITTEPNELVRDVHDRMPVILTADHVEPWLEPQRKADELAAMLRPYPAEEMESFPVSTLVNSPRNDAPECIRRHEILDLFGN